MSAIKLFCLPILNVISCWSLSLAQEPWADTYCVCYLKCISKFNNFGYPDPCLLSSSVTSNPLAVILAFLEHIFWNSLRTLLEWQLDLPDSLAVSPLLLWIISKLLVITYRAPLLHALFTWSPVPTHITQFWPPLRTFVPSIYLFSPFTCLPHLYATLRKGFPNCLICMCVLYQQFIALTLTSLIYIVFVILNIIACLNFQREVSAAKGLDFASPSVPSACKHA